MRKLGINLGGFSGINAIDSVQYVRNAGFDCVF